MNDLSLPAYTPVYPVTKTVKPGQGAMTQIRPGVGFPQVVGQGVRLDGGFAGGWAHDGSILSSHIGDSGGDHHRGRAKRIATTEVAVHNVISMPPERQG